MSVRPGSSQLALVGNVYPMSTRGKGRGPHESNTGQGGSKKTRNYLAPRVYRVGYSWNRGGRLKELRIRHLARKFLNIWMKKTFGRVHPRKARSYHRRRVLQRAFEGWREEWWSSRREWSLTVRADCHYRYYLYSQAFHGWQRVVSACKEKKRKFQNAACVAERRQMRVALDSWEVYLEMRRMKSRMLESALQFDRLATLRQTWTLWLSRLQRRYDVCALEDDALDHWALTLQRKAWDQWRAEHTSACSQRELESKASLHHTHGLQRKVLGCWKSYVHHRQAKRKLRAVAVHAGQLRLVRTSWGAWCSGLQLRQRHADRLQAADRLAQRSTQCRALGRWKNYVEQCVQEAERDQAACQHHRHHLLRSGLRALTLNVSWSKTHRLNKNIAVHHYHHTITSHYWKVWQLRLEEAEDRRLQPHMEIALANHRTLLLSKYMCLWKERLAEHRDLQGLERRAEAWFSDRILPQCLDSWVEVTLQGRQRRTRRDTAERHNQQRLCAWAFYTWWGSSEEGREQRLAERMAVLHDEQRCVQRAWRCWMRRALQEQQVRGKQTTSDAHYQRRLLLTTLRHWRDNATEIRNRRTREEQADRHCELLGMRRAMIGWSKYVQNKREKNHRLEQMERYHQSKLLKHTLEVWKEHQRQSQQIYSRAEESYSLQQQHTLRRLLGVWRENAALLAEVRAKEQRAETHFRVHLQAKLLSAWRRVASCAVSKRRQQREILSQAQSHMDHLRLQTTLRRWSERRREVLEERTGTEKAGRHHRSTLLSRAFRAWGVYHQQHQRYEGLKRRGMLLLRQKTTKHYFECWKVALQHRGTEAEWTEQALWHWSLTLQAKVLEAWRSWAWERRRKQERLAAAAGFYRLRLLREGVAHVLTHAAHASGFSRSLAQHSQEQTSRRLQGVVLRCALKWKRRALCAPGGGGRHGGAAPPRKSVTFRLPSPPCPGGPPHGRARQPGSVGQGAGGDAVLNQLAAARASRLQPRRPRDLLQSPVKQLLSSSPLLPPVVAPPELCPSPHGPPPSQDPPPLHGPPPSQDPPPPHGPPPSQDLPPPHGPPPYPTNLLLPPSSFMTTRAQTKSKLTSGSCPRDRTPPYPASPEESGPVQSAPPGTVRYRAVLSPRHAGPHGTQLCLTLPVHAGVCLSDQEEEEEEEECVQSESDPTAALTGELLDIRTDMRRHLQDRKQLQAWQRLKEVLKSWLQTSASEGEMEERSATSLELEELEERIRRLSAELAAQKPEMLLHAARIQRIQAVLLDPDPGHSVLHPDDPGPHAYTKHIR